MTHLKEFYDKKSVPKNRIAHLIVINNKWIIVNTGPDEMVSTDGKITKPYVYFGIVRKNFVGAIGLLYLVTSIQNVADSGSQKLMSFRKYFNQIMTQLGKMKLE